MLYYLTSLPAKRHVNKCNGLSRAHELLTDRRTDHITISRHG